MPDIANRNRGVFGFLRSLAGDLDSEEAANQDIANYQQALRKNMLDNWHQGPPQQFYDQAQAKLQDPAFHSRVVGDVVKAVDPGIRDAGADAAATVFTMNPKGMAASYLAGLVADPSAANFANTAFQIADPMQASPGGGFNAAGMTLSSHKNVSAIARALAQKIMRQGLTQNQIAEEFMRLKYPKLYGLAEVVHEPGGAGAAFSPGAGKGMVTLRGDLSGEGGLFPAEGAVETLGHELEHANQWRKDPIGMTTSYIPPSVDEVRYLEQAWEQGARKAGSTAMNSFGDFMRKLGGTVDTHNVAPAIVRAGAPGLFDPSLSPRVRELISMRLSSNGRR